MDRDYQFLLDKNILILRTSSFRPERGSILHSGIFNRELASVLSASVIGGVSFVLLSFILRNKVILYIISLVLFTLSFLFFRIVVFKESDLETVFDKDSGLISINLKGPLRTKHKTFPIITKDNIFLSHVEYEPSNPEGIEVVERVALQHGTVIPGFGEKKEFYNVDLLFEDGEKVTIYSSKEKDDAEEIMRKIKSFLGGDNSHDI